MDHALYSQDRTEDYAVLGYMVLSWVPSFSCPVGQTVVVVTYTPYLLLAELEAEQTWRVVYAICWHCTTDEAYTGGLTRAATQCPGRDMVVVLPGPLEVWVQFPLTPY